MDVEDIDWTMCDRCNSTEHLTEDCPGGAAWRVPAVTQQVKVN